MADLSPAQRRLYARFIIDNPDVPLEDLLEAVSASYSPRINFRPPTEHQPGGVFYDPSGDTE